MVHKLLLLLLQCSDCKSRMMMVVVVVVKKDRSDGSRDVRVGVSLAALIRGRTGGESLHSVLTLRGSPKLNISLQVHQILFSLIQLVPLQHQWAFLYISASQPGKPLHAPHFYRTSSTILPLLLIKSPPLQTSFDVQNLFWNGAFIVAEQCVMWVW